LPAFILISLSEMQERLYTYNDAKLDYKLLTQTKILPFCMLVEQFWRKLSVQPF
jgi:hypothetical protein